MGTSTIFKKRKKPLGSLCINDLLRNFIFVSQCPCAECLCAFSLAEERERAFNVPEIIMQSNTADTNSDLPDPEKMPCSICHRLLKRQPLLAPSAGEHAIVAVLVCGHLYHADCLEHKTPHEEKTDPPCPICLGLTVHADEPVIELD